MSGLSDILHPDFTPAEREARIQLADDALGMIMANTEAVRKMTKDRAEASWSEEALVLHSLALRIHQLTSVTLSVLTEHTRETTEMFHEVWGESLHEEFEAEEDAPTDVPVAVGPQEDGLLNSGKAGARQFKNLMLQVDRDFDSLPFELVYEDEHGVYLDVADQFFGSVERTLISEIEFIARAPAEQRAGFARAMAEFLSISRAGTIDFERWSPEKLIRSGDTAPAKAANKTARAAT